MGTGSSAAGLSQTDLYRQARDLLQDLGSDYAKAVEAFTWPDFGNRFNWAIDWFDANARGNDGSALWIVEEDGSEAKYSFAEMTRRSDQVAAFLAAHGVTRGDHVLLMLNNQVELWEAMLAVMKLGAVILPTTTALGPSELVDRIDRGKASHVLANAADTVKFDGVPGDYTRFAVGDAVPGWLTYRDAYGLDVPPAQHPGTAPSDPQLLYFTSGTTSRPKLVEHSQVSYPVGHLATSFWVGARPGDVHLNISSPGWAKHAWSCFFAPWIAQATIFIYNYSRFDAAALLGQIRRAGVTTFCAPPTVWRMLIKADLSGGSGQLRELLSAGEPLNPEVLEQVQRQWGLTIRDGFGQTELPLAVGNAPGSPVKPGSMGRPLPGVPIVLVDPVTGQLAEEGEICVDLSRRPMSLMTGYQGDPVRNAEAMAGGYYHWPDRRRVQGIGLQDLAVRAGKRADRASRRRRGGRGAGPGRAAAGRAQGLHRAGTRVRARPRHRPVHPAARPREPRSVPAGPADRVLRAAEDHLGQDPPGRLAAARGGSRGRHDPRPGRSGVAR